MSRQLNGRHDLRSGAESPDFLEWRRAARKEAGSKEKVQRFEVERDSASALESPYQVGSRNSFSSKGEPGHEAELTLETELCHVPSGWRGGNELGSGHLPREHANASQALAVEHDQGSEIRLTSHTISTPQF
jgi:hypothetical protein